MSQECAQEGFRPADDSGIPVPSRMLLLQFLGGGRPPATFAQICEGFALNSAAGEALAGRLGRMQAQGLVLKDRAGRYALPARMDIWAARVSGHANGYGFAIPDDGGADLFLHHRQMRKVLHGDRILVRQKRIDERGRKEGVVIEVLVDIRREIVGHYHFESGVGFVEPDDSRYARDIAIPDGGRSGAENGDIVAARIIRHPVEHGHAVGEIVEVIGQQLTPGMETAIAIRKHDIPHNWPDAVPAQLKKMGKALQGVQFDQNSQRHRQDIRDLPLVTIDGADARDFDDAVYCAPHDAGWRLVVAIADVSHYVAAGTALDQEAYRRGNSVYFPNRVVPMLPPELSTGICSLNPGEDRYCMACDMRVDSDGEITDYQFYPALMHSQARLTYAIVDKIIAHADAELRQKWQSISPHLDNLAALAQALLAKRQRRGAIDFEFPEPYIEFDENQKISRISIRPRNQAHRLIEECMLAANQCAARYLQAHLGERAIYRNHRGPSADSAAELRRFLGGLGLALGGDAEPTAADYAQLVAAVAGQADMTAMVQPALLRSLSQAVYSAETIGHFALAYPVYTHFTSPIRRYSDLVVHRQIRQLTGAGAAVADGGLEKIAERCSFTERRADDASRDVVAWLKAEFMQDKVGEQFDGAISGVREFGVFVQLDDIFVDGLIHVTALGDDYYHFDAQHMQLRGERGGRSFRLGDRVRVAVSRVSLDDAKIDFALCDQAGAAVRATSPKAARKSRPKSTPKSSPKSPRARKSSPTSQAKRSRQRHKPKSG